jgi:hypothetical protein
MRKPLAGKRYFEALGRSHQSLGLSSWRVTRNWPQWARVAYVLGYNLQQPWRKDLHFTTNKK